MRRRHRRTHRLVWLGFAALLPLVLAAAWGLRQHRLPEISTIRLVAPASDTR